MKNRPSPNAPNEIKTTVVFSKVADAYARHVRKFFLQGSSRSGKTYNFMLWLCVLAYNTPDLACVVVRSTMPRLKRTVFKDFRDNMMALGLWEKSRMNFQNMEYTFPNNTEVSFFATEDPAVAQGLPSDILFINEATEIKAHVYTQLCIRCTGFICIDYNPNFSDDHWIKKEILLPQNKGRLEVFKTTYKDNPFLPQEQIDEIESLKYTNEALWRIYGLGEQALVEGLIYDAPFFYADAFPAKLPDRCIGLGIDYGYKDPFAVVKCAIYHHRELDPVSGKRILRKDLYVQQLAYDSLLTDDQQFAIISAPEVQRYRMFCDPSVPQFIKKARTNYGLRIRGAIRASTSSRNSILPGIQVVKSYRMFLVGDNPDLERELRNYCYQQDRDGNYTDKPIDQFNHLLDAIRYFVYTTSITSSTRSRRSGIIQQ